jgi:hypothetical protein
MSLKLRHPVLDEEANHPPERQPFSRRSGVRFIGLLPGFAACVGLFFLLVGLAEHPPASRIVVELALLIPLAVLIVWSITKRVRKYRMSTSIPTRS